MHKNLNSFVYIFVVAGLSKSVRQDMPWKPKAGFLYDMNNAFRHTVF